MRASVSAVRLQPHAVSFCLLFFAHCLSNAEQVDGVCGRRVASSSSALKARNGSYLVLNSPRSSLVNDRPCLRVAVLSSPSPTTVALRRKAARNDIARFTGQSHVKKKKSTTTFTDLSSRASSSSNGLECPMQPCQSQMTSQTATTTVPRVL